MPKYVAVERMPWGKYHIQAGDELVDPKPEGQLLELLIKSGRVKEKAPEKKKADTYLRRDIVAEQPQPTEAPRRSRAREDKPDDGKVGAMTTETLKTK